MESCMPASEPKSTICSSHRPGRLRHPASRFSRSIANANAPQRAHSFVHNVWDCVRACVSWGGRNYMVHLFSISQHLPRSGKQTYILTLTPAQHTHTFAKCFNGLFHLEVYALTFAHAYTYGRARKGARNGRGCWQCRTASTKVRAHRSHRWPFARAQTLAPHGGRCRHGPHANACTRFMVKLNSEASRAPTTLYAPRRSLCRHRRRRRLHCTSMRRPTARPC